MVLAQGQHTLDLSFWSMSGLDIPHPERTFCGDSYPYGLYPHTVPEGTTTCLAQVNIPDPSTPQPIGPNTIWRSRQGQKDDIFTLSQLKKKKPTDGVILALKTHVVQK